MAEAEVNIKDTIGDVRAIIVKGRWWILLTMLIVTVGTVAALYQLPNLYSSEATLEIVQPSVSTRFVEPTSYSNPKEAVDTMTRTILSRTRLLAIVTEFNLYAKERPGMSDEDTANYMRKYVTVDPIDTTPGSFTAFKISFSAENPQLAQTVTNRLTSVFIEENRKAQQEQATVTTGFLQEQLDAARRRVEAQDDRQRAFSMQYLGELPDQQVANLGLMTNMQTQLDRNLNDNARLQQEANGIESSLKETLDRLQAERTVLLNRFTPRHPDVLKKEQEIAKVQAILLRLTQGTSDPATAAPTDAADPATTATLNRVNANRAEKERLSIEEKRLKGQINQYESRLNLAPVRQDQLSGILRDRDINLQEVKDLQTKLIQAQQSNSVVTHEEGRQFRLIDPPTLPEVPISPRRIRFALSGAGGGLFLGIVLALFQRVKNTSFRDEKAVSRQFKLPFVVGVPLLLTSKEERVRRVKTAFEWAGATVVTCAVLAAEFFVYRHP